MAEAKVIVDYTETHRAEIVVSVSDPDDEGQIEAAVDKALAHDRLMAKPQSFDKGQINWELQNDSFEVIESYPI